MERITRTWQMVSNTLLLTSPSSLACSPLFLSNPPHASHSLLHSQLRIMYTSKFHHYSYIHAKNFDSESEGFSFHAEEDDDDDDGLLGKKIKWWSDEPQDVVEEEEEAESVLDEFLDSIWILKVFRSFGWTLPPIILSLLLATGLKSFLIALALPFGQSAFSFALEKMWGRPKRRKRRRYRTDKTRFTGRDSDIDVEDEEEESQETRKGKMGYQSWVDGNASSVNEDARETSSFGGWDELERSARMYRGRKMSNGSKRSPANGRVTRKSRSQSPLLLRLLIAAFPFLSSWTKLFW